MRIATWNVNSIKARLDAVTTWLAEAKPDLVMLQELKCRDEDFPAEPIEALGYNLAVHGQKSYNGVAILSKRPFDDWTTGLAGDPADDQARYIEAVVSGVRFCGLYLPNGNPTDSDKFPYKLAWMDRLIARAEQLLDAEESFVMAGDYNIIPSDDDVFDPEGFADDALARPESRRRYRTLGNLGLTDAFRAFNKAPHLYSYWDYQRGAWQKDFGVRIDHLLLSPQAADIATASGIDRKPRGRPKASDHTPVWCDLDM